MGNKPLGEIWGDKVKGEYDKRLIFWYMEALVEECLLDNLPRVKPEASDVFNSFNKEQREKEYSPSIFNHPYLVFRFHITTKLHQVWRQCAICKYITTRLKGNLLYKTACPLCLQLWEELYMPSYGKQRKTIFKIKIN